MTSVGQLCSFYEDIEARQADGLVPLISQMDISQRQCGISLKALVEQTQWLSVRRCGTFF